IIFSYGSNETLFLRPILDGCNLLQGILIPRKQSDFHHLQVPYRKCHLNNSQLNVSVKDNIPFCQLVQHANGSLEFLDTYLLESEILRLLESRFRFKSHLILRNGNWGAIDPNTGKWKGTIDLIRNGVSEQCSLSIWFKLYGLFSHLKVKKGGFTARIFRT